MITELEKYIFNNFYKDRNRLSKEDIKKYMEYLEKHENQMFDEEINDRIDLSQVVAAMSNWQERGYNAIDSLTYSFKDQAIKALRSHLVTKLDSLDPDDFQEAESKDDYLANKADNEYGANKESVEVR